MKTSEKASISAKLEVPVGDVNAVNPEAATTEAKTKLNQKITLLFKNYWKPA